MIKKLCRRTGYLIEESDYDTTNILCRFGHIYSDGRFLVASLDAATKAQSRALRKLGEVVADGDHGELSVRVPPTLFRDVCRILRPRQKSLSAVA